MIRRRCVAATVLMAVAGACSSGAADESVATVVRSTAAADPALETRPVVQPEGPASTTLLSPAATTTTASAPETVELRGWGWGAPCRVPVAQRFGPDNLAPDRTFDMIVIETENGYSIEFDAVEARKGSVPADQVAQYLAEASAALPAIRLDEQGRFVQFVDLDVELIELERAAGRELDSDEARIKASALQSLIERQTFGPWFGFWVDRSALTVIGSPVVEERSILGVSYDAEVVVSAAAITSEAQVALFGPDAARFAYGERGSEIPLRNGGSVSFDVEADAIIDAADGRPFESTVWLTMFDTSDGRRTEPYFDSHFRYVVQSWFDWDNAEGCE